MTLSGSSRIKLYQFAASTCSDWLVSMPCLLCIYIYYNPWWTCRKW